MILVICRPGVAGAVLQTPPLLINSFTQTVRARKLKFRENVHPPPRVACQVSGVRVFFFFSYKVVGLVGGWSVINGAYPV